MDDKQEITTQELRQENESVVDDALDTVLGSEGESETPSEPSSEDKPQETEPETQEPSEDETSQKSDEGEEKEPEVPEGFHNHPAWQRIIKERDELRAEKEGKPTESVLSESDRTMLNEAKTVMSSPEYIRASMKSQGYTQEAINARLGEMGHEVKAEATDTVDLVTQKLGINMNQLEGEQRNQVQNYIHDIASIADILISDRINKTLPEQLKPLQEGLGEITKINNATKLSQTMQDIVVKEGILDYEKEIVPKLDEWLDTHEKATQEEAYNFFKQLNHELSIDKLRAGARQQERDDKRDNLKGTVKNIPSPGGKPPEFDDKDTSGSMDKVLDHFDIKY